MAPNWVSLSPLEENASQNPCQKRRFQLHCDKVLLVGMCLYLCECPWVCLAANAFKLFFLSTRDHATQCLVKKTKKYPVSEFSFRKWRVPVLKQHFKFQWVIKWRHTCLHSYLRFYLINGFITVQQVRWSLTEASGLEQPLLFRIN